MPASESSTHAEDANLATIVARLDDVLDRVESPSPTYRGKVRDVYAATRGGRDELLIVTTDRVSAFDVVLGTIPLKGALLTEQATFWLERARDVVATHLVERVDAQIVRVRRAEALPVELVVRGYLAGSLAREPVETRGHAYGIAIDPSVAVHAPFESPIITPTTKAPSGEHDLPLSVDGIVRQGLVARAVMDQACEAAKELYRRGAQFARARGLLLVDTKYEFGLVDGALTLIDEIHTADSSRYWRADTYDARMREGNAPDMLDKERLRRWLLARGFSGHGAPPALDQGVRTDLCAHYWSLTEQVTGKPFVPPAAGVRARVAEALAGALGR